MGEPALAAVRRYLLAADVRDLGRRAFALLEQGLGGYAAKPPA